MVCNLQSRVFSSETLIAGVDMVERAEGLPADQSTQELLEELAKLEVAPSAEPVPEHVPDDGSLQGDAWESSSAVELVSDPYATLLAALADADEGESKVKRRGETSSDKVLRRMMQPRCDGTYLLPQEVLDEYKDISGGGRDRVLKMWAASSHDKVFPVHRAWLA
eukprot:s265_g13.t1